MKNRVIGFVGLVCIGFGFGCSSMNAEMPTWFADEESMVYDQQDFTQQIQVPRNSKQIEIIHYNGNIEIAGWDEPYILLQGTKRASGNTVQEARGKLEFISIYPYEKAPDRLVLEYNGPSTALNFGRNDTGIDVKVSVPQDMPIHLNCRNGDVKINNIQNSVTLDHRDGDVLIQSIRGETQVESHGRNVIIKDIGNRLIVKTVNANLSVDGVQHDVSVQHANGEANLADIEGIIIAYGDQSRIQTKQVKGRIQIENSGGDVVCDSFQSGVQITLKKGTIRLQPKGPLSQDYSCEVETGDIILRVPQQASMLVDMRAEKGSIQSDFTLPISAERGLSSAMGAVNGGQIPVKLYAKNGSVSLLKEADIASQ